MFIAVEKRTLLAYRIYVNFGMHFARNYFNSFTDVIKAQRKQNKSEQKVSDNNKKKTANKTRNKSIEIEGKGNGKQNVSS